MKKENSFSDKKAVRRVFSVIFIMALTAAFFACFLISIANDIYAFIKSEGEVAFTLSSPVSLSEFSNLLYENDVISNPHVFNLYVKSKNKAALFESLSGQITLDRSMSYREILIEIQNAK